MIAIEAVVCPVDECGWQYLRVPPPVGDETLASVFGPGVMKAVALADELQRTEQATREHMSAHSPDQYLRTITRLRRELGEATSTDRSAQ